MTNKKIVIVAGDKSGDLYGGLLAKKLKAKSNDIEVYSFGGKKLAENSTQIINLLEHSVTGLVEVIKHLPKILAAFNKTVKETNRINPDLVILIDFPDFNLRLAKKLNNKFKLFYYVSPQVWAWRKERIEQIRKYVNKMIVIFKFEEEFFLKEKIPVVYFGHPLLEILEPKNIQPGNLISFMPGSRKNVIKHHLPIMIQTKRILETKLPGCKFQVIRPENIEKGFYQQFTPEMEITPHSQEVLQESRFIIASSGTATVEIAILEIPYLLIYKMNALSWWILKKLVNTRFAGMVNILAGKEVIKELLQEKAMPLHIAAETLKILNDEQAYQDLKNELRKIKDMLAPAGSTEKFAEYILKDIS